MKDVSEEFAKPSATATLNVAEHKSAKIDCAKSDAEAIPSAQIIKLVSISSAKVTLQSIHKCIYICIYNSIRRIY